MNLLYINLNILSAFCVLILLVLSYKNKEQPGATSFLYSMVFLLLWVVSTTLQLLSTSFFLSVLFVDLTQLGMAFVSVMNYRFVLYYTELSQRRLYKNILHVFTAINILAMLLLFTDPLHHLLRSTITYTLLDDNTIVLDIIPTQLGSFFIIIRFLLFGVATLLLFRFLFSTFKNMRKQVLTIGLGFLIALISLLLKQYVLEDLGVTVPMSVILIFPYIFIGIGIFRFNFLSISPLAKDWVINSLKDGIVVFSKDGKILECNDAANTFIKTYGSQIAPESLMCILNNNDDSVHEICVEGDSGNVHFEITLHHLFTNDHQKQGSVAVIHDITEQIMRHNALIQKADLDSLTQVFNKKAIEREYALMNDGPICLLVIDVDKELCLHLAERLQENLKNQVFNTSVSLPPIEVSIGAITNIDNSAIPFNEAYNFADRALYEAKGNGRNLIVVK